MRLITMQPVKNSVKIGQKCGDIMANITEDSLFMLDDEPVGFYLKQVKGKARQLLEIANKEFRGDNVPKANMSRGPQGNKQDKLKRMKEGKVLVEQYSTVIGSMQPKPHMKRPYPSMSAVHQNKKARIFIKAMYLLAKESSLLINEYLPKIYKKQKQVISENVEKQWRFSDMFTSSISNYNISAPYHRDTGNLKETVNVIYTKRFESVGGYLNIPDYDITIECANNSMICYPAWKNIHGVTPIRPNTEGGYRNSLIFYPLKGFAN